MALIIADRVQQTGSANTTVSFTLSGSVTGYQSFAVIGNGNTTYYGATDTSGNWEVGIGTYSTTGPTLTRTTIISSSNSGSAVTFSGTVNVFVTYPAEDAVIQVNNVATVPFYSATATITGSLSAGAYSYGTLSYSDVNIFASYTSSVTTYNQMILQNTNSGSAASSDYVVSNNNGTASAYYGDFGINSSGWTGTSSTPFNMPNAVYVSATSGPLAVGTTTSNPIYFAINGALAAAIDTSSNLLMAGASSPATGPSGQIVGTILDATNGIHVNSKTVSSNYTIPSGSSAMSAGPITISSGVTVTVSSGSRWVVL